MVLLAQQAMSDCLRVRACVKGNVLCACEERYYSRMDTDISSTVDVTVDFLALNFRHLSQTA